MLRGQLGKNLKCSTIKTSARVCIFYYANVDGFMSKADSINQLVAENNVDILLLDETKVYSSKAVNIKIYPSFPARRKDRQGGGIFIGSCETIMVSQRDDADFVIVCLKYNRETIRLILAYLPRENDSEINRTLFLYGPQENDHEINRNLFYQNLSIQNEQAFLTLLPTGRGGVFLSHTTIVLAATLKPWLPNFVTSCFHNLRKFYQNRSAKGLLRSFFRLKI